MVRENVQISSVCRIFWGLIIALKSAKIQIRGNYKNELLVLFSAKNLKPVINTKLTQYIDSKKEHHAIKSLHICNEKK